MTMMTKLKHILPYITLLLASTAAAAGALPLPPWPLPNATLRPTFHLGGLDNAPGYVGDANGMMFRRVPWNSPTDQDGLFHVAWQCFTGPNTGLNWCHSTSKDFVTWKSLPPMYNRTGGGAESGGVAQLQNGDVVAIFNQIRGGGHWQARPVNISDPHLTQWRETHPNGTSCGDGPCVVTPGIPGTDLSQPYLDGSGDGFWRVVADRGHGGGVTGAAMLTKTKDFLSFEVESTYHEYKWTRCVDLPAECGFGPYPRDPNTFLVDKERNIWVFYGMQKTCSFSGREFYVLGTYNKDNNHTFVPLDAKSDYANNVWDGGEGYASMHVYDPIKKRILWMTAVIENDRDACGNPTGEGFWRSWMVERDIGRGWFGTLGLPRVVTVENLTDYFSDGSTSIHLITAPLPELATLRDQHNSYVLPQQSTPLLLLSGDIWVGSDIAEKEQKKKKQTNSLPRGQAMEYLLRLNMTDVIQSGSDIGLHVLWNGATDSKSNKKIERTTIGVRDGTYLSGIDLWDQVSGDVYMHNATKSKENCRNMCLHPPTGVQGCTAWTYSDGNVCRLKEHAQHALQVASDNGAFLPYHSGCVSGYIHSTDVHYLSLYIDRTTSTTAVPVTNTNYSYPAFNYSKLIIVVPKKEAQVKLHVFVDGSIVEAFAMNGRSVVTARVYPFHSDSNQVAVFNRGSGTVHMVGFAAYGVKGALASSEDDTSDSTIKTTTETTITAATANTATDYQDPRDITNGIIMLEQIYTDQPYCTQLHWDDNMPPFFSLSSSSFSTPSPSPASLRWVCVVTANNYVSTNGRSEGGYGEHVVSILSKDLGKTWSTPVSIELAPPQNVPNAYGIIVATRPLKCLNNRSRLYTVYNLNYDNITASGRNDELGYFYMKWSDDGGTTWSSQRKRVPYPSTWIDRHNIPFNGTTNIMWTVDHVKVSAYISILISSIFNISSLWSN